MKKIRTLKLLCGSLVLGWFVSGCGNVNTDRKGKTACYDTIPITDYLANIKAEEDSIFFADSLKNANSDSVTKQKSKVQKEKVRKDHWRPPVIVDTAE
jgi:hypothetical protein